MKVSAWRQFFQAGPAEHLSALSARHHITSSIFLQHKHRDDSVFGVIDPSQGENMKVSVCVWVCVCDVSDLYAAEAERTVLAVGRHPDLTQTILNGHLHPLTSISAL